MANGFHVSDERHTQHYVVWILELIPAAALLNIIIKPHDWTQTTNYPEASRVWMLIDNSEENNTVRSNDHRCWTNITNYFLIMHTYTCPPFKINCVLRFDTFFSRVKHLYTDWSATLWLKRKGRNVLTGNMRTSKHYASPSDKTGPKNETSCTEAIASGFITDAYYRCMMHWFSPQVSTHNG